MKGIYLVAAVLFLCGIQIHSVHSQISSYCLNNNYQTFAYSGSNSYYYYCYNNQALLVRCPANSYYTTSAQTCISSTGGSYPGSQYCPSTQTQTLPDWNNCQNYILCVNGQAYGQTCQNGLYFDQMAGGCTPSIPSRCNGGNNVPSCSGYSQNQYFADPTSCQRYYQCYYGQQTLNTCPGGYYFSTYSGTCGPTRPASCGFSYFRANMGTVNEEINEINN